MTTLPLAQKSVQDMLPVAGWPDSYNEWVDEIAERYPPTLPPRDSMITRLDAACSYGFFNLVKRDADGAYRVPSRQTRGIFHRVTDEGCDCQDWRYRGICAHFLATGPRSDATFLIARISRARNIEDLHKVLFDWFKAVEPCQCKPSRVAMGFSMTETDRDACPIVTCHCNADKVRAMHERCLRECVDLITFARIQFKTKRAEMMGHNLRPAPGSKETARAAMKRLVKDDPFRHFTGTAEHHAFEHRMQAQMEGRA